MSIPRRLLAIAGLSLAWGAAWAGVGALLGFAFLLPGPIAPFDRALLVASFVVPGALVGFLGVVGGSVFASLLSGLERSGTLETLSAARAALWGSFSGSLLPLMLIGGSIASGASGAVDSPLSWIAFTAGLGAVSGAVTLRGVRAALPGAAARRALEVPAM